MKNKIILIIYWKNKKVIEHRLKNEEIGYYNIINDAKRFSLKKADEVEKIEMLRGLGVKVMGMYILGYESDTRESCLATIEYAKRLNTNIAVFSIFTPYPGTPIFVSIKDRITGCKFEEYILCNSVFKLVNLS